MLMMCPIIKPHYPYRYDSWTNALVFSNEALLYGIGTPQTPVTISVFIANPSIIRGSPYNYSFTGYQYNSAVFINNNTYGKGTVFLLYNFGSLQGYDPITDLGDSYPGHSGLGLYWDTYNGQQSPSQGGNGGSAMNGGHAIELYNPNIQNVQLIVKNYGTIAKGRANNPSGGGGGGGGGIIW